MTEEQARQRRVTQAFERHDVRPPRPFRKFTDIPTEELQNTMRLLAERMRPVPR